MKRDTQTFIRTLTQNQQEFPNVISLDVHDENTYLFGADIVNGDILIDENSIGSFPKTLQRIKSMKLDKDKTIILYEAGNMAFYPYRLISAAGYYCKVIAPSSIPRRGKEQKTDRDDARDNLQYHVSGHLHYVTVPTVEDENARECLRYRIRQASLVSKTKQQTLSFVKRHGLVFTLTKTNWTQKHFRWLRSVELTPVLRELLNQRLYELDNARQRLMSLEGTLDQLIENTPIYKQRFAMYRTLPGLGRVNSMIMVIEGGSLDRFSHPESLMNFTGLVPKKFSSGSSDPALHITKAGNFFMRLALVGASKAYGSNRTLACAVNRANKLEEPYKSVVTKAIQRLSYRYRYLRAKNKHVNKVKCAIARELCAFCWELFTTVECTENLAKAA